MAMFFSCRFLCKCSLRLKCLSETLITFSCDLFYFPPENLLLNNIQYVGKLTLKKNKQLIKLEINLITFEVENSLHLERNMVLLRCGFGGLGSLSTCHTLQGSEQILQTKYTRPYFFCLGLVFLKIKTLIPDVLYPQHLIEMS